MKNRLKKVMMESETSVDELAKSLNCSYGIVKYLQDGKTDLLNKLTGKEIERLAKYFHTNPAYLVGWSDDPSPIKEKKYTVQLITNYSNGFLNIDKTNNGVFLADNGNYEPIYQAHFTQAEIDELKQRDDIAIAWDKAKIEEVEDDE